MELLVIALFVFASSFCVFTTLLITHFDVNFFLNELLTDTVYLSGAITLLTITAVLLVYYPWIAYFV